MEGVGKIKNFQVILDKMNLDGYYNINIRGGRISTPFSLEMLPGSSVFNTLPPTWPDT